ncbi:MAG: pentapeptide repeat-containing protein [Azoarcus sp.]|jgi:hypothetical protein|nr:pentapeptide repeat-containing protein [Azoarcus sp.]
MSRRKALKLGASALLASLAGSKVAATVFDTKKKPIKEFGKVYSYLKKAELRDKEKSNALDYLTDSALLDEKQGLALIEIKGADFSGEDFYGIWKNYHFINCHFPASQFIRLEKTINCTFTDCDFGPGRKDVALSFGRMENCHFHRCKFLNGNIVFGRGEGSFVDCTFTNTTTHRRNDFFRNYLLSGGGLLLTNCRFYNVDLGADTKLHMKSCQYVPTVFESGQLNSGKKFTADFILEDTQFTLAKEIFWNNKFNNLTLRGCRVEGLFSTLGSHIKDTITLEGLSVGTYYVARTGTEKSIIVRDCNFSEIYSETGYLFSCSGSYAVEFLMERVVCTDAAPCNLTGAGPNTTEKFFWEFPRNQTFTLRNCKIPRLMVNGLMTYRLVIENCEFGTLELRNARPGKVTIKNTKFATLDLTRTLAEKFEIDAVGTGRIITDESNYPNGGFKIDKGK